MRTKSLLTLGLLGLVVTSTMQAEAKPQLSTAGTTIVMGGGFFGLPGVITADPSLSLFITSSSVVFTDGFGALSTNYINQDISSKLSPLAAGQKYAGELDAGVINGPGPFLFTMDYTASHQPPAQITATGFLTINYVEGVSLATGTAGSLTVPFRTPAAVPEPGVVSLLMSGLVGSGLFLLRRRRK